MSDTSLIKLSKKLRMAKSVIIDFESGMYPIYLDKKRSAYVVEAVLGLCRYQTREQ